MSTLFWFMILQMFTYIGNTFLPDSIAHLKECANLLYMFFSVSQTNALDCLTCPKPNNCICLEEKYLTVIL